MARLEDHDLLIGAASFVADIAADGCLHAHFVRSTDAHATIQSVDVGAALTEPGVVAVHTSATIGLGPHVHLAMFAPEMNRFALADGTVRHVGEAVAVVVAKTSSAAEDAAEHVLVELEPLNPVLDARTALEARPIYPAAGTNLVHEIAAERPDPIVDATNVVDVMIANQRLASAPIETDGIVATPTDGGIDVWCTTQGVHSYRDDLASALDLDSSQVRVRAPAVGGAFGGRVSLPVEFVVVAKVAIMLGRPVRWHQSRFENLTAMAQGRDISSRIRLGYEDDGTLTGLDVDAVADAGATAHAAASLLVSVRRQAAGLYRVPEQAFRWRGRGALTNTPPVGAYRGAGQPEANHARERAIDIVALRLGVDPVDLRLRNLFSSDDFPLTAAGGVGYDSGDPRAALVKAVELLDLEHWRGEQLVRRERGSANEIGIGVACYAQTSGRGTPAESVLVRIADTGRVLVASGSPSHGQGHRTTWSNLVSQRLGVEPFEVDVVDADTAAIDTGLTTGGSRTSQVLAGAIADACDDLVEIARPLAAAELEAADEDIVVVAASHGLDAGLAVRGVPTSRVTWGEIAAMHAAGCIEVSRDDAALGSAHPYGAHASVVAVDTDTGHVRLLHHVAVDDCGAVLEPEIVEGQQHGGSVAGIAQALWEFMSFDDAGNPQTALFTNYGLPSAGDVCNITTATLRTSTDRNVLGTRGIGENGCNGATPATHNAVIDALAQRGIEHIDMPLTPQRVWRALAATREPQTAAKAEG